MYIPRMIKEKDLRSLAVSGSRISQQISLQFVSPATFCVCDTFGNIFRNVDTVKQGRSEPRAKKAKEKQLEPQSPSQASCIYQPAGPWREEEFSAHPGPGVMGPWPLEVQY